MTIKTTSGTRATREEATSLLESVQAIRAALTSNQRADLDVHLTALREFLVACESLPTDKEALESALRALP